MKKSSVGSQSCQNINPKTETQGNIFRESKLSKSQGKNRHTLENLPGVKVVKISMLKTDPDGKMLRESKLSKFQGKIRDTEDICCSQICQDFKPKSDSIGKLLRESKLSSFKQISKNLMLIFFSLDFRGLPSSGYGGATEKLLQHWKKGRCMR